MPFYARALVADDDPISRGIVSEQLLRLGIGNVRSASSGRQALNALQRDDSISLLLTDLKMPDMDGMRLLRELESHGRSVDVIIMSALGNKILRSAETIFASNSAVRLLGAIGKPVSPKDLRAALQNGFVNSGRTGINSENPVSAALDSNQHHSMLQPVLNTHDDQHPLALVQSQWTHPGLINRRDSQIDAEVEQSELAHSILRHHMRNLGKACALWQDRGTPSSQLAFSLTAEHLQDRGLADWAQTIGARFSLQPDHIIFLVDERALVTPPGPRMVNALAEAGFGVGIHHYGEGDTALGTMQSLPIDIVVTAPSLAARMDSGFEARMLLESTLRVTEMLQIDSVAAGVDNDTIRNELQAMGYKQLTGNAVSPSLSTEAYPDWLKAKGNTKSNAGSPENADAAA